MLKEFEKLNEQEVELLIKAPLLTCILIAGADGNIDRKEIKETLIFLQKSNGAHSLADYFNEVSKDFEDKLKVLMLSYPYESTQRDQLIVQELSSLNTLWPKVPKSLAIKLYEMLRKLAETVASSSGGLWGINTVASEEEKYLLLPMLMDPSK